jgi:HSP20 family molecular chaperone IbpA
MASNQMQRRTPSPFGLFPLLARDMDLLQENMRRILQGGSNQSQSTSVASALPQALSWVPPVEIRETNDELTISAELAGVDADAVSITIDDDVLTISGVKQDERRNADDDSQYYLVERTYGEFARSFTLPSTVDPDSVEADFDNGVLNIHLRKRDAARQRGRQIPISSGSTRSVGAGDAGTSRSGSQRSTSGAGAANFGSTSGGMVAGSAGEAGSSTGGSASSTSGGGMSASGASSGSSKSGSTGRSGKGSGSDSGMSASSGGSSGSSTGGSSGSSGGGGGSGGSSSGGSRS